MSFAGFDLEHLVLGLEFGPGLQLLFEQLAFQLPPFLQQVSLLLGHR